MARTKRERLIDFNEFIAPHGLEDCLEIFRINHGNPITGFWSYAFSRIYFEIEPLEEGYQVRVTDNLFNSYQVWVFLFAIDEDHSLVLYKSEITYGFMVFLAIILSSCYFLSLGFEDIIFEIAFIATLIVFFLWINRFYVWRKRGVRQLVREIKYLLLDKPYP
jgi:hypothetical protein